LPEQRGTAPKHRYRLRLVFMRSCREYAFHIPLALRSQLQNAPVGSRIISSSQAVQAVAKVDAKSFRPRPQWRRGGADSPRSACSTRCRITKRISSLRRPVPCEILLRKSIRFAAAKIHPARPHSITASAIASNDAGGATGRKTDRATVLAIPERAGAPTRGHQRAMREAAGVVNAKVQLNKSAAAISGAPGGVTRWSGIVAMPSVSVLKRGGPR
jgi:hypothetical protein